MNFRSNENHSINGAGHSNIPKNWHKLDLLQTFFSKKKYTILGPQNAGVLGDINNSRRKCNKKSFLLQFWYEISVKRWKFAFSFLKLSKVSCIIRLQILMNWPYFSRWHIVFFKPHSPNLLRLKNFTIAVHFYPPKKCLRWLFNPRDWLHFGCKLRLRFATECNL